MSSARGDQPCVLLTGATGFIGHYLLAELLRLGRRCVVLLRPPLEESFERLAALLWEIGVDAPQLAASERLMVCEGSLSGHLPDQPVGEAPEIIHAAAATNFRTDSKGEPARTNVHGMRQLLDWADRLGAGELHLVSSAYVCGKASGPAAERFDNAPPEFHNDYEKSKWEAERLAVHWSQGAGRRLTIYRPSVVVGEYASGRSVKFSGFYISARATEFLDRVFEGADQQTRQTIPLRLRGRPDDRQNIVPVDYVAATIAAVVARPQLHGRVYHIVHPDPPSNQQIKEAFESHFMIGGGRWVPPGEFDCDDLNEHERRFYEISRSIEHYFVDTPAFRRENTAEVEQLAGIRCGAFDRAALDRLVRHARAVNWGRGLTSGRSHVPGCAVYFESFLPKHVGKSRVARMTALSATMRFVIEDEENGEWVCRFDRGRLMLVQRGPNGVAEDFGYRSSKQVFWESISGAVHPQELFLTGRAEVFGDVEGALKMAMILHEFTREFPCDPDAAQASEQSSGRRMTEE